MAKLAKKYITMAAKTVPSSQWKARGLKKAWALQKASKKGGGKTPAAKKTPAKKKGTSVAKSNPTPNKAPKIGAVIQSVKGAQAIAAPFVEVGVAQGFSPQQNVSSIKTRMNAAYAGSLLVEGANHAIDRKIAHGGALSRGSVTAWGAELFAAKNAFDAASGSSGRNAIRATNTEMSKTIRGYDPGTGTQDLGNANFRLYHTIKIGGGVARRLSNMGPFKKMAAPLKKALGQMGLAL